MHGIKGDTMDEEALETTINLFEVKIFIESDFNGILFTGKLVKSLLIDANPKLKPLFRKERGALPKLIHITPLYREKDKKCIYSWAELDEKKRVRRVHKVSLNGFYSFYLGFIETQHNDLLTFDNVYNAILNISGKHKFKKNIINVEFLSAQQYDIPLYARQVIKDLLRKRKAKIVFSSPTLLRDPIRTSKYKSLVPNPINVFSTPIYIYLYLRGSLRTKLFKTMCTMLHRIFNETYSLYKTTKIRWIIYNENKNPIPTIIGYVNFYLNEDYYERYNRMINLETYLQKILEIIMTLGTGTSRATGFGHILIS